MVGWLIQNQQIGTLERQFRQGHAAALATAQRSNGFEDVITGKEKASALQSYLRDVLTQTTELLNQDVSVADIAKRVDLTSHKKDFPEIQGAGVDVNAVKRVQSQLEEPEPPFAP